MKKILTIISLTLCASIYAHADDVEEKATHKHHRMDKTMMEKVDTNKDGKFDRQEFIDHAEQRFDRIDEDGDGFITKEEGEKAHKAMREKHHHWSSGYKKEGKKCDHEKPSGYEKNHKE